MSNNKSNVNKNGETLEDFLGELEQVVDGLESGDLSLEESLGHFEKGVVLYKRCKNILSKAESRISVLTDSLKEDDWKEEE
ncbi:MAG: exodeoxyribonuclease VII small subunit [Halobacteriovoraceae bacterium]|nr:exodeoxyribonuclease VII small subunit [Halobacteriovoraceae bacterium]